MAPNPHDVFIPGGLPSETYVARDHLNLEADLGDWLERRQKPMLTVAGPTKSGKTVLLRKLIPEAISLSGGAILTVDDFWRDILDKLEVFTEHQLHSSRTESLETSASAGVDVVVANAGGELSAVDAQTTGITRARTADPRSAARAALSSTSRIVVIDDFHYIPANQQVLIVRGLKDLIFDGLGVVAVVVPHRAYDVVRVEKEMTGRVEPFPVSQWSDEDLRLIAEQGFTALEVHVDPAFIDLMAQESFGSPHLMQTHCLNLSLLNRSSGELAATFVEPEWTAFFQQQASATSKLAFDLLKNGPRTRTDRIPRELTSGVQTDIYGAVLAAIENTGPRTTLSYDEIRASLREILTSELPQRHEVTNVLEQMTEIARDKIDGEPVLEYDADYSTLHLADPFFAYYLRWAPPELKDIAIRRASD